MSREWLAGIHPPTCLAMISSFRNLIRGYCIKQRNVSVMRQAIIILKLSKSKQYEEFYSMYYNRVNGFFENGMTELSDFLIILSKLKLYLDENY